MPGRGPHTRSKGGSGEAFALKLYVSPALAAHPPAQTTLALKMALQENFQLVVITHDEQARMETMQAACIPAYGQPIALLSHTRGLPGAVNTQKTQLHSTRASCSRLPAAPPQPPPLPHHHPPTRLRPAVCAADRHPGARGVHVAHHQGRGAALDHHAGKWPQGYRVIGWLQDDCATGWGCPTTRAAVLSCLLPSGPLPGAAGVWRFNMRI